MNPCFGISRQKNVRRGSKNRNATAMSRGIVTPLMLAYTPAQKNRKTMFKTVIYTQNIDWQVC